MTETPFASERGSAPRWLPLALIVATLVGAALTAYGWFAAAAGTWRTAKHVPVFAGAFVLVAVLVVAASRWRRGAPLPIGALMLAAIAALTGQLGALLAVATFGFAAAVLGRLVLRRFPAITDLEALLLGLVLYGTTVGLMVAWPINYPGVYAAMVAAPLLLGWRHAQAMLQRAWAWASERRAAPLLPELVAIAVAAITVVHFLVVLMPEFGHDALVSHLMMPARIAWRHVWEFDVDSHVWCVMPALGDWLYTIGHVLAGETGARLVNFGCILLLGRLVFEVVRWLGGDRLGGLVAVLLYLTTPLTLTESSSLFIEAAWTCLVVGGALAVLRAAVPEPGPSANGGDARHLLLGGALLGGALAAKAVTFMVLPVLALVLVLAWRRWLRRDHAAASLVGLGVFLFAGLQPYVRAYWLTGNPVFPFFNGYFRSPHYALEDFSAPDQFPRGLTWDVLYRMTFASNDYLEARPGAAGFQWLLLLVPVAVGFVVARHRRGLLVLGIGAAIAWLTCKQTAYLRYVFPTFALASASIGAVLGGALPRARASTSLLAAAMVATVALNLVCFANGGFNHAFSLPVLTSPSSRAAYVAERQPLRAAVWLVNELNAEQAPVAMFGHPMVADLRADVRCPNWYNFRFLERVNAAASDDALGELLARERVRYLILTSAWQDEVSRQRVRAVSSEVKGIGDVSVRRLDERFQFRSELLRAPTFAEPAAWHLAAGARIEPGTGAVVSVEAPANQLVEVVAGREYRLTATARRADAATAADARLQVNWLDADGRMLAPHIQVFACLAEATSHSMDVVAPAGATAALVYASGHAQVPVVFTSLSFKN